MNAIGGDLRELEEQLFDSVVRKNYEMVSSRLADDFREFGSSGRIFTKEEILAQLANERGIEISAVDFQAKAIARDAVLVTYRAVQVDPVSGTSAASLRSSIWVWRGARWQMLFHQGTKSVDLCVEG